MSETITLTQTVKESTLRYALLTIEDRAIPDFRDGLKPVHRRIVYAAMVGKYFTPAKTARLVGDVIGKYHPHGDIAVVDTITNMVHECSPLMHGSGNWGSIDRSDGAAGMRYTECCLSHYGKTMITPSLMEVSDFVPNYDDKDVEPVVLPFQLPNLLLNGTFGVATGVSPTNIPAFEKRGVILLLRKAYSGKRITPKDCVRLLKVRTPYGGICTSESSTLLDYYKTGNGSLSFECDYTLDTKNHIMHITGLIPYLTIEKFIDKATELGFVKCVFDESPMGTYEVKLAVQFIQKPKAVLEDYCTQVIKKAGSMAGITRTMCTQVTERTGNGVTFRHTTVPQIIMDWAKWRKGLEKKRCIHERKKLDAVRHNTSLLLDAIKHREGIIKALSLRNMRAIEAAVWHLIQQEDSSYTIEDARFVLALQVRRLANLDSAPLQVKIIALKKERMLLSHTIRSPGETLTLQLKGFLKEDWSRK